MKNLAKKNKSVPQPTGWISTDTEEIEKRRLRGQTELMKIRCLDEKYAPFSSYTVSTSSSSYTIEIRSLNDLSNSCSCPDFQTSGLGTCKHIEGVLYRCKRKTGKSPLAEIYISLNEKPQIRIVWPNVSEHISSLQSLLGPYFSANNILLSSEVTAGIASIQNALNQADPSLRNCVRISPLLLQWLEEKKRNTADQYSKEQFLADVKEGKRTLQMLSASLYPYQEEGMLHLAFQRRAILADEMGLGKTIQAIAAAELLRRQKNIQRVLIVCPASLKGEWEEQIAKFTPLPTHIVQGTRPDRIAAYRKSSFFYIANYEQVRSDFDELQQILAPDLLILDEAQRIKNWQTKTASSVKKLQTPYVFVLTGTPIENRIDDIYSIMQVVDPQIFGPLFKFNREFYKLDEKGKPLGYKNLEELHRRLHPVLLRRLKKDVEEQLPERTINNFFVKMTAEQRNRYQEYSDRVARMTSILKRRPLTADESKQLQQFLACMRMIADTPYILDPKCRDCPKLEELKEIFSEICQNPDNKIIIFSEWERMLFLIKEHIEKTGIAFAWHTGSVRQDKRREEIKRFKEDPACRFFLTTDAGSTGLNLQVANTVINVDLPWNPAKLEQRIARAWRKHQTRAVQVINLVCEDSIEYRMLTTLAQKQQLATGVLDGDLESDEMDMPSGRAAFVERLENLLSDQVPIQQPTDFPMPSSPHNPVETIKDDILSRFTDRVQLLQFYEEPELSRRTLLAVVDRHTPETESHMQEVIRQNFPSSPPTLVLFDQATFASIKALSKSGIFTLHEEPSQLLYRSPHYGEQQATEREKQRQEAQKQLSLAERKMSMATLLASGQFFLEALPPASEALSLGMKVLVILKIAPRPELIQLQSYLNSDQSSDRATVLLQSAKESLEEISQTLTQHTLLISGYC